MSEGLKDKMYNYEVTPPGKTWERIVADLDDSALDQSFPSTLYEMQVTPPEAAWERISSSLDEKTEAPVRKISRIVYYAAAAAVIGIMVLAGYQLFYKSPGKKTSIAKQEVVPVDNKTQNSDSTPRIETPSESVASNNQEVIASLDLPIKTRRKNLSGSNRNYLLSANLSDVSPTEITDIHDDGNENLPSVHQDSKLEKASRYILLMTPEGNIVRMSKKLGELVCCVSGQEQDDNCKSQLKEWRDKVMHSSSASPGNFMDILNMVTTLQNSSN